MPRPRPNAGFSLVDMAIAIALAGTVAGSAAMLVTSTTKAYGATVTSHEVSSAGARALIEISTALRQTSVDQVVPAAVVAPLSVSQVEFRRAVGLVGTDTAWGDVERIALEADPADPVDGVDNDDDGFVDERQVVHRVRPGELDETVTVLCRNVLASLDAEVAGNLIDDNGNGLDDEAGLAFDFENGGINVRMSVGRLDPDGQPIVRTFERALAFRNYGS